MNQGTKESGYQGIRNQESKDRRVKKPGNKRTKGSDMAGFLLLFSLSILVTQEVLNRGQNGLEEVNQRSEV